MKSLSLWGSRAEFQIIKAYVYTEVKSTSEIAVFCPCHRLYLLPKLCILLVEKAELRRPVEGLSL